MSIASELLAALTTDAPVTECCVGPRLAAVWSRRVGLASRPDQDPEEAATLVEGSVRRLAHRLLSDDPAETAVGLAAFNSLMVPDPGLLEDVNAYQLILEHGAGRRVAVVGHFPFVEKLRQQVDELFVLELDPAEGDLPASKAPEVIPRADVVALTGSSLVNHTMDSLLDMARGKYIIVLGPSTPLSPVLFDHGVAALGGAIVEEPERVLEQVEQGVTFRHMEGARHVVWCRS